LIIQHRAIHAIEGDIWLEDYANFEYDENNEHQKTFIISRDITRRKLLELKLQEESEKRRQIAELLIESKITYNQSNILYNWLNYGEWI